MTRTKRPTKATVLDFRDTDIMHRLAEAETGGATTLDVAEMLGFAAETGGRSVGMRLAYMRKWGMVAFNDDHRTWSLSRGGRRVVAARELAPSLVAVEKMPDERMIDVMAHVTSRFHRGETMLATMLRREFAYGTQRR